MIELRYATKDQFTIYCDTCEAKYGIPIEHRHTYWSNNNKAMLRFVEVHENCGESKLLQEIEKRIENLNSLDMTI
jgi:hypothetical protein